MGKSDISGEDDYSNPDSNETKTLGLISPPTIRTKILLQKLWQLKIGWDERLPYEIIQDFNLFMKNLSSLNSILINRQVIVPNYEHLELHGLADASQEAYGCCICVKSISREGDIVVRLLRAKSRVAPYKTITFGTLNFIEK
nr:unnamed protein product [Callosobruchus analis]